MTVTVSIVPTLTRAQLLEIHAWTLRNQHAAREHLSDPFAGAKQDTGTCSRCREHKHHRCNGSAWQHGRLGLCACFADDHKPRRTR